ncbi:TetR/AcrR family transcriptional regulator [Nocardia sp. NPDC004068]|uniref:TetR/AcrR family transcriptional regulator n=1 Tax=Nocardia sp. NPDC004068 TaxID=3364303 RepID=UPI003696A38A
MSLTTAPDPHPRADARRNRALILRAAQQAFAERGTEVSLAEIARRAGVGAGTVHRHFPAKADLLEAVVQQRIDGLAALALRRRGTADPGAALIELCVLVVTRAREHKAVCDLLGADDGWPRALLPRAGERFRRALGELLAEAQRHGDVRADLTVTDVEVLIAGCVAMQRASRSGRTLTRPAAMLLAAMRVDGGVTKPADSGEPRNETHSGYVTSSTDCAVCGAALRHSRTGRPARYCSAACRQKAHRERAAAS